MTGNRITIDEQSLFDGVIRGDTNALAQLFDLHRPRLRRIVNFRLDRRIYGRVDPDDVLQEAYFAPNRECNGCCGIGPPRCLSGYGKSSTRR